jgi:arylsulfatase A-like enzyme
MSNQVSRRDFLKLAGALPFSFAAPRLINTLGTQQNHQNIIVLVFDALSAYHIALHGYPRDTMPKLSRLAERAVVYHNHYAGGNFTTPGTASLLTGTLPWTHRAFDLYESIHEPFVEKNLFAAFENYYRLAYTHNLIADVLLEQLSVKMDDHVPLGKLLLTNDEFISTLFDRDENAATLSWTRAMKSKEEGYAYSLFLSRIVQALRENSIVDLRSQFPGGLPDISGENYFLLEDAINWLGSTMQNLSQPFMGYFHFLPPHGPYHTHKEFFGHFDRDGYLPINKPLDLFASEQDDTLELLLRKRTNYDEFILYVDRELGRFMESMEINGLLDNTWIVLTSDHGELFERGIVGHLTQVLYEPVVRVPLVIFEPGRTTRLDIHSNTSAVDVLPTLLHVTGQKPVEWSEGTLLPPFSDINNSERSVFVVQARKNGQYKPISNATIALVKERYKLMYFIGYPELGAAGERIELYDLKNDPEELNDLSISKRETTEELLSELKQKLARVNEPYI